MRKFLFLLLIIPAILALGHDTFIFAKAPEKGFKLSDAGVLWDKYHKESHVQWKVKLNKLSDSLSSSNSTPESPAEVKPQNSYNESFTQTNQLEQNSATTSRKSQMSSQDNNGKLQKFIVFLLEQKALFIFSGLALFFYLINAIISHLFRERTGMENLKRLKKKTKKKNGGRQYNRK